jgi:hypothetical protein
MAFVTVHQGRMYLSLFRLCCGAQTALSGQHVSEVIVVFSLQPP